MTNRELINELKQQSCRVNAMKAKMTYRSIANELLRQIPEARILRSKPVDLLDAGIPDEPALLDDYHGTDLFYYHFVASMPDGRAVRIRADNSLERFRIYRLYWQPMPPDATGGYQRDSHMAHDSMVCNRSNSNIAATVSKLAKREPTSGAAPTPQQLQDYLNDQYNNQ